MGRNSGGTNNYAKASGGQAIAVTSNGKKLTKKKAKIIVDTSSSLSSMKHKDMEKQIARAISRYETVMGVRERNVRLGDLNGAYGATYFDDKGSKRIILDRKIFDTSKKEFETNYKKDNYETGFKNVTNRAAQHTVTHELAHATWTSSYSNSKAQAAGKDIKDLYKRFMKDKKKKGYGDYGKSNVDEFWAEVITKGIHGTADRYTKRAINIAKKYKL